MIADPLSERRRADALLAAGRPAEAIPLYRRLAEGCPEEESHLLALAWALHDSGRREEARDCFERLFRRELARKVCTGFAYDELVRICREERDWEGLLSLCERAAAAWPEEAGVLRTLGEAYREAGRPAEAIGVFGRLTALSPESPDYWCALGNARLAGGDPAGAAGDYDRAVRCEPAEEARFMGRLAAAALAAGFPHPARTAWERCLALKPDEMHYEMGLGEALLAGGEWDAAEEAFGRAAALRPADAGDCWRRLGKLLLQAGLPERAVAAMTRAVRAQPDDPRCRLELAAACAAAGRPDDAAAALAEAARRLPGKASNP